MRKAPFNILVVDPSPDIRQFTRRVLQSSDIPLGTWLSAEDGKKALDLLRVEWVDLILIDFKMPVMDGEQMLRILAADPALRTIPVIVVASDPTPAKIQTVLELGAKAYISKPFLPATLRTEVARVLEKRR